MKILKEAEACRPVSDICREIGISATTFYKWKTKYGGMEASDVRRLKDLEAEHSRLKQMFAELSLENQALKDVSAKNWFFDVQRGIDPAPGETVAVP